MALTGDHISVFNCGCLYHQPQNRFIQVCILHGQLVGARLEEERRQLSRVRDRLVKPMTKTDVWDQWREGSLFFHDHAGRRVVRVVAIPYHQQKSGGYVAVEVVAHVRCDGEEWG